MVGAVRIAAVTAVFVVAGALGAGLAGCSAQVQTGGPPAVSAADLQKDLTGKLTRKGMQFQSVTCDDDLPAEVGKSVGCDVRFGDANEVEAVFTATKVEGKTVTFEVMPAMTKDQAQKAVSQITSASAVTCDSGLDGTVGATADCEVTKEGVTTRRVAEVTDVDPAALGLRVLVVRLLDKGEVEGIVAGRIEADTGQAPDSVDCAGGVAGRPGTVVACAVTAGEQQATYDATVTAVRGDVVDVDVVPQS